VAGVARVRSALGHRRGAWDALEPNPAGAHGSREAALQRRAGLATGLELRDDRGALVPTDQIELMLVGKPPSLRAFVIRTFAHTGVPA
jgi:hypothetical protein